MATASVDPIETTEEAIDKSAKPPRLSALTPSPLATFEHWQIRVREGREQLKKVAKGGREPEHRQQTATSRYDHWHVVCSIPSTSVTRPFLLEHWTLVYDHMINISTSVGPQGNVRST